MPILDAMLPALAAVIEAVVPLYRATPGTTARADIYASYRQAVETILDDPRAALRSPDLLDRLALIADGYRAASAEPARVIDGFDRVVAAARAVRPPARFVAGSRLLAAEAFAVVALAGWFEVTAVAGQARAVADLEVDSYQQSVTLRHRLTRSLDVAIDRASDRGDTDVMRALREVRATLVRDLIERGRPLARIVAYSTAVPLPAVVVAHRLYQDAGRAVELRAENGGWDHPAFMPMAGVARSR